MQNLDPNENKELDQKDGEQEAQSEDQSCGGTDTSTETGVGGNGPVKPPNP